MKAIINEKNPTFASLSGKLNPTRFSDMSAKMAAIVGYILGLSFTDPKIAELVVTSDKMVLARQEGDCGCNDFIGNLSELESNWTSLLDVADLTEDERGLAGHLYCQALRIA